MADIPVYTTQTPEEVAAIRRRVEQQETDRAQAAEAWPKTDYGVQTNAKTGQVFRDSAPRDYSSQRGVTKDGRAYTVTDGPAGTGSILTYDAPGTAAFTSQAPAVTAAATPAATATPAAHAVKPTVNAVSAPDSEETVTDTKKSTGQAAMPENGLFALLKQFIEWITHGGAQGMGAGAQTASTAQPGQAMESPQDEDTRIRLAQNRAAEARAEASMKKGLHDVSNLRFAQDVARSGLVTEGQTFIIDGGDGKREKWGSDKNGVYHVTDNGPPLVPGDQGGPTPISAAFSRGNGGRGVV